MSNDERGGILGRTMRKFLPALALALLLTACGSETVQLRVAFDTTDILRRAELKSALERVMENRMLAAKKTVNAREIEESGDGLVATIQVSDSDAAKMLEDGLTAPFSMTIMKQVKKGQGDIISEKYGEFKETGVTTKHFDWITAGAGKTPTGETKGVVVIEFTKEGQELLRNMFAHNRGSVIGIFVRGQLMSKKLIDAKDTTLTSISIDGIPSPELAATFADDVNVGLHVMFTALP